MVFMLIYFQIIKTLHTGKYELVHLTESRGLNNRSRGFYLLGSPILVSWGRLWKIYTILLKELIQGSKTLDNHKLILR